MRLEEEMFSQRRLFFGHLVQERHHRVHAPMRSGNEGNVERAGAKVLLVDVLVDDGEITRKLRADRRAVRIVGIDWFGAGIRFNAGGEVKSCRSFQDEHLTVGADMFVAERNAFGHHRLARFLWGLRVGEDFRTGDDADVVVRPEMERGHDLIGHDLVPEVAHGFARRNIDAALLKFRDAGACKFQEPRRAQVQTAVGELLVGNFDVAAWRPL